VRACCNWRDAEAKGGTPRHTAVAKKTARTR
jgi:hypothetical protein